LGANLQRTPRPTVRGLRLSLFKAVSWRILGSLDTFILSAIVIKFSPIALSTPGNRSQSEILEAAAAIAIVEVVTKLILYTCHEQIWQKIDWARVHSNNRFNELKRRSIVKTAIWRIIAFMDTTMIAFFFTGSGSAALTIGFLEILTKMVLYYFHERLWLRVPI